MGNSMRRKCVIIQDPNKSKVPMVLKPDKNRRDNVDRSAQFEAFVNLLAENGVDITGKMPGQKVVFGWVEKDHIPVVRALDEVAAINDDYAYLVQETSL